MPRSPDAQVIARTTRWIERTVIGLGLCPFAQAPVSNGTVRFVVSRATQPGALLSDLRAELERLACADPATIETTLIIHPEVLTEFEAYNDFLDEVDRTLAALGQDGEIQVASFHPDYRFADTAAAAAENYTNRSPYPMLHLLREDSVSAAVDAHPDTAGIGARNIAKMRALSRAALEALRRADP